MTMSSMSLSILNNPCAQKCDDDEPVFILIGRDPDAPGTIRYWANSRERRKGSSAKTEAAFKAASQMEKYAIDRTQNVTLPDPHVRSLELRSELIARVAHMHHDGIVSGDWCAKAIHAIQAATYDTQDDILEIPQWLTMVLKNALS